MGWCPPPTIHTNVDGECDLICITSRFGTVLTAGRKKHIRYDPQGERSSPRWGLRLPSFDIPPHTLHGGLCPLWG